tara:strand:+ start:1054389 stop:1058102 length:3714 start_codon:yes stop_codon:yes gene_type:complete
MLAGDAGAVVAEVAVEGESQADAPVSNHDVGSRASESSLREVLPSEVIASESLAAEIAIIDASVDITDEVAQLGRRNVDIVVIDSASDPLDQITEVLRDRRGVTALHIVSHGSDGQLMLGGRVIDTSQLTLRSDQIAMWQNSLSEKADILLYGCDVSASDVGTTFIQTLARLTSADVAASTDRTGTESSGGDWVLESTVGQIDTDLFAASSELARIDVTLPITIRAAGSEGDEEMQLQVAGEIVQTWTNVGGNAYAGQYQTFTYDNTGPVDADDVRVLFTNAIYLPAQGIDRNLRVDNVTIDGVVFESEDPSVYSTGTWRPDDGIQPGFRESEFLHGNGYFQYGENPNSGSVITIYAAGNENAETMQLWIGGENVKTWTNIGGNAYARQFEAYQFTADSTVTADDIQVHFTNARYQNNGEIDYNLRVDRIVIDSATFQTEAPNVYSTGTWQNGSVTPGFKQSEMLHSNGYFQYGSTSNAGTIALETSNVQVDEDAGSVTLNVVRSGGSDGQITVDYATQSGTASGGTDFLPQTGTLTFADGETVRPIVIPIVDDDVTEPTEEFNVTIENVLGGATLLVPRTATVTIIDDGVVLPDYVNFSSVAGLNLNGVAAQVGDELHLTATDLNEAGSAFFETPISLGGDASFRSSFSFRMTGGAGGADGLAFAIHNDSQGSDAIGGSGGALGFSGITNAIAVEFDSYQNPWDINANHVSILDADVETALRTSTADFDLNDGSEYFAWVDYNGTSDVLAVYLSDSASKPTVALLKTIVDLESQIGSTAYFGFTAATGGLADSHQIGGWQLDQQDPPLDPPTQPGDTVTAVNVITGVNQPTAVEWLPNGSMLIAQKSGVVRTASNGSLSATPFIDISGIVNDVRDRGLLDIAVHPEFEENPYVYLLFTYDPPEVNQQAVGTLAGPDGRGNRAGRLIRVTADVQTDYQTAVAGSEVVLLGTNSTWDNFNASANSTFDFDEPPAGEDENGNYVQDFIASDSESHTVGGLAFGVDGNLFVSIGDGASYNQVDVRADRVQDIDSLSGKILRIDPLTGQGLPDNPHFDGNPDSNRSKVYQRGLRNPFRISVDPVGGQLFIGDVGWGQWEEVNAAGPGANFGWPFYEGGSGVSNILWPYANTAEGADFFAENPSVDASLYALSHQADGINAIVMGDVYRGPLYGSEYVGDVFFNDLGQGIVRHASLDADGNITDVSTFTTGANVVVAISQGPDGALYFVDLDSNLIGRWEIV